MQESKLNELDILRGLKKRAPHIGDDCAVIPNGREDLLFTTDMLIEGVHFLPTHAPKFVGAKAILRALSDIAAMGGEPRFCLLSLALPSGTDRRWIDDFYHGVFSALKKHKTELVGGDLAHAPALTCDVVTIGAVPKGKALLRSGARPGDSVYVSGPLGRAAAESFNILPKPRINLGQQLRGLASACMDLSDGLSLDLHRLCLESKVAAHLDLVPIAHGATLEQALHGGEDYELLFTSAKPVPLRGIKRIGTIRKGTPGLVEYQGRALAPTGYDHFRK